MNNHSYNNKIMLIGPMGAGKTTLGKRLAAKLGRVFIDTDALIVKNSGADIALIFEREGEQGFRQREYKALLQAVTEPNKAVIACGGGIILLPENRSLIMQQELVIFLDIPPEKQLERVATDKNRPLARGENKDEQLKKLQRLRQERIAFYENLSDIKMTTDNSNFNISFHQLLKKVNAFFEAHKLNNR